MSQENKITLATLLAILQHRDFLVTPSDSSEFVSYHGDGQAATLEWVVTEADSTVVELDASSEITYSGSSIFVEDLEEGLTYGLDVYRLHPVSEALGVLVGELAELVPRF